MFSLIVYTLHFTDAVPDAIRSDLYIYVKYFDVFQGAIRHDEDDVQGGNGQNVGAMGAQGGTSVFSMLNQRLLDAGLPSWNAGPYDVQPIVSIGVLLAFMLFGWGGLFFAGMLFLVTKWSQAGDGPRAFINNIGLGGIFSGLFGGSGGGARQRGTRSNGARTQGQGDDSVREGRSTGGWGGGGHKLGNS